MGRLLDNLGRISAPKRNNNGWVGRHQPETGWIAQAVAGAVALVGGSGAFLAGESSADASAAYAKAEAAETTTLEALDLTVKAKVEGGVLVVLIDYGGFMGGTKMRKTIPLNGIPQEVVAQLENNGEFKLRVVGENHDGVFKGRVETDASAEFEVSGDILALLKAQLSSWRIEGGALRPLVRDAVKVSPATAAAPPPPPPGPPEGLVKPYDPRTFFVSPETESASMGPDQPRGFDIEQEKPFSFYVTGDPNHKTEINFELYPWVPVKASERAKYGPLEVQVFIDGVHQELPPQDLPKGKILKSSRYEDMALWDEPILIPAMTFGPGTHEVTFLIKPFSVRAVLRGATPTSTPKSLPALEIPFEDDSNFPPEFSFHGEITGLGTGDYKLKAITGSPVLLNLGAETKGMKVEVLRIPEDSRVRIKLTKGTSGSSDYFEYESDPIEPGTAYDIAFRRMSPPARSTDRSGPDAMPIYFNVTGDNTTGYNATIDDDVHGLRTPPDLNCEVTNVKNPRNNKVVRALAWCWEKTANGVRALRTTLDAGRPAGVPKRSRHRLEEY
ncbi:MAG: hypothetical protein AAB588_01100 [Patescibacteria group bacterium]